MRWLNALVARARGLLSHLVRDRDGDAATREEFQFHVDEQTAENIRRGMSPDDARRSALIAAGGLTAATEAVRERQSFAWAENLFTDARYALRSVRLNPGYSWAVILTLALGISANATIFTIVNAVVLRPLPYPQADRIVSLSIKGDDGSDMEEADNRSYEAWRASARSFAAIGVYQGGSAVLRGAGRPQTVRTTYATHSYFDVLGIAPEKGRLFTAEETGPGAPPVAVISEQLWRSEFGADPRIIGQSMMLDDSARTIIGIMPVAFTTTRGARIWLPLHVEPVTAMSTFFYAVVARLRPGVSVASARAELEAISARLPQPRWAPPRATSAIVMTLHDRKFGDVRRPLYLLLAAVGTLLLIACVNLANLAMARSVRRQREFSLRRALGARGVRLVSHVLLESAFLSFVGAALGLVIAAVSIRTVVHLSPSTISHTDAIGVDARVVLFTFATALVTALAFGLAPAHASLRGDLNKVLSAGSSRAVGSARQRRVRGLLVIGELATALVLLTGAALVAKSFWRAASIDPGFRPEHLLAAEIELPWDRYKRSSAATPVFTALMERVQASPAVGSPVLADAPPLGGARFSFGTTTAAQPGVTHRYEVLGVGDGYFRLLGIKLLEGRLVGAADGPGSQPVVVITRAMAHEMFPDGHAIGQSFRLDDKTVTVVGIVANVHQRGGLEGTQESVGFVPMAQIGTGAHETILFRTGASPAAAEGAITSAFAAVQPLEPPPTFTTMDQALADEVAPRKFLFVLLGTFAGLAGVLAVIGLYGVLSYLVAEQTREIGIRAALGADQRRLKRHVLGKGMTLVGVGTAIGIFCSLVSVKTLSSLLYQMDPRDPITLAAASGLLVAVSLLACYLPARRASRLDPISALRVD